MNLKNIFNFGQYIVGFYVMKKNLAQKMRKYLGLLIFLGLSSIYENALGQNDNPAVGLGQWRIHLPYNSAISLTEGDNKVFCATKYGLFSYEKDDGTLERYSRITGLNDLEISSIRYNNTVGVLLIAYINSNIDLLFNDNTIVNLSDIERKNIIGSKSINHIYFKEKYAYLSCGFGIVVIDLEKKEVKDTYYIGPNGSELVINQLTSDGNYFYAATATGIYKAPVISNFLYNYETWVLETGVTNIIQSATSNFTSIASAYGKTFVVKKGASNNSDTLLQYDGISWSLFSNETSSSSKFETVNNLLVYSCYFKVQVLDANQNILASKGWGNYSDASPMAGYLDNHNIFWLADANNGLVKCSNDDCVFLYPNGPHSIASWAMKATKDNLWVAAGAIDLQGPKGLRYGTYYFDNYSHWKNFNKKTDPGYDTLGFADVVNIAIDPNDPKHAFIGTWGSGVLEYRENGIVNIFNLSNSTLKPINHPTWHPIYIGGMAFDEDNNLWISNPMQSTPISVRKPDGSWKSFSVPGNFSLISTFNLIVDDYNQKWINGRGSGGDALGLGVFNENDIDNPNDDSFTIVNSDALKGALPSLRIFSLAKDKDGAIWIGSDQGVAVIYNPGNVFSGGNYNAQKILIEQDGHAQYLLETEYVMAIAIDGANRKWFGTLTAGAFLMSADGTKQILNLNTANSPLLSNRIYCIDIDPTTGEVFFGTEAGICSYRSDATEGGEACEDYYVFPNPITHDYRGPIAIQGLVANASVKITDLSGQVVYQTKAKGGLASWDGNNFSGLRAKTGVYLVYITNEDGSATCVTKMLFTN
jgi:hypothetical protein